MPKLDLTFPAGALSDDAKRELPREQSQFVVEATVPAGALSERRKDGVVEEFSKLIRDAAD